MKWIIHLVLFLASSQIFAQDLTSTSVVEESPAPNSELGFSFGAGVESTSFNYLEPNLMKISGQLFGFNLDGAYQFNSYFGLSANFDYLFGPAIYDGQLSQSGKPIKSNDNFKVTESAVKGQILVSESTYVNASLYLGTGQRTTEDANDPTPSDYYRKHVYNYHTAGIRFDIPAAKSNTSVNVGFDKLYSGQSITNLSDFDPAYQNFDLALKEGSALNIGVVFSTTGTSSLLYAGLDYKKWVIAASTSALTVMDGGIYKITEPKNETTTLAFKAGLIF